MFYFFTRSFVLLTSLISTCAITPSPRQVACPPKNVTFPPKDVLRESFRRAGLIEFVKITKLKDITKYKVSPALVNFKVRLAFQKFDEFYNKIRAQNPQDFDALPRRPDKSVIMQILLQADSDALQYFCLRPLDENEELDHFWLMMKPKKLPDDIYQQVLSFEHQSIQYFFSFYSRAWELICEEKESFNRIARAFNQESIPDATLKLELKYCNLMRIMYLMMSHTIQDKTKEINESRKKILQLNYNPEFE